MRLRPPLIVTAAIAIAGAFIFAGLIAAGSIDGGGGSEDPPAKQTAFAVLSAREATNTAFTPLTKPPTTPVDTPASCPLDPKGFQAGRIIVRDRPPSRDAYSKRALVISKLTLVTEGWAVGDDGAPR